MALQVLLAALPPVTDLLHLLPHRLERLAVLHIVDHLLEALRPRPELELRVLVPGARQALSTQRVDVAHTPGEGETRRPSDAEGTASGDAAGLVRRELDRHRREGLTSVSGTAVTWHPLLIAGTAALTVAAVLSLALPHG